VTCLWKQHANNTFLFVFQRRGPYLFDVPAQETAAAPLKNKKEGVNNDRADL
jgi:hypothetical protein